MEDAGRKVLERGGRIYDKGSREEIYNRDRLEQRRYRRERRKDIRDKWSSEG
jgi:hypothetical protein